LESFCWKYRYWIGSSFLLKQSISCVDLTWFQTKRITIMSTQDPGGTHIWQRVQNWNMSTIAKQLSTKSTSWHLPGHSFKRNLSQTTTLKKDIDRKRQPTHSLKSNLANFDQTYRKKHFQYQFCSIGSTMKYMLIVHRLDSIVVAIFFYRLGQS